MKLSLSLSLTLSTLLSHVAANADKIIFTGPAPATIPLAKPSLSDLNLDVLGPAAWDIRTNLTRVFPSRNKGPDGDEQDQDEAAMELELEPPGHSSWFLLDNLTAGKRYELRLCWAAIQPTNFALDVYDLDTVWETPRLISSLAQYATTRQLEEQPAQKPKAHDARSSSLQDGDAGERTASVLLLHVHAAADYFTTDKALMQSPPPVLVDLILDPYLYNAVPHSLLLTIWYIIGVAIFSVFVAGHMVRLLTAIGLSDTSAAKKLR